MAQLVTRVQEALVQQVDELVEQGIMASRSEAVRVAYPVTQSVPAYGRLLSPNRAARSALRPPSSQVERQPR